MHEDQTLNNKEESLQEVIQDVTLTAWPLLYGESNPFDLDSRALLQEMRGWALEFHNQWENDDPHEEDYMLAVEQFASKKAIDYREPLLREYLVKNGFDGDTIEVAHNSEQGSVIAEKIRKWNWLIDGETIDLFDALGESTLVTIQEGPVPRDFTVNKVANIGGAIVLQGTYADNGKSTAIDLDSVTLNPSLSDDILDDLAQATKNIA